MIDWTEAEANPLWAAVELANHLGVANIKELPGCWEYQLDEAWWFAMNGHRETVVCSRGMVVPPFSLYVEYYGWPAGILRAPGDGEFAAGTGANPLAFAEAVRRAMGQEA